MILEIEKVTPDESLRYMIPIIREAERLDLKHNILDDMIIIRRPSYLPKNRKDKQKSNS